MYLIKKFFELSLIIMVFVILCSSQVASQTSSYKVQIDEKQVEEWTAEFTDLLFNDMNPRETLGNYVFYGKLTNEESKLFPRKWLNPFNKKIPEGFLKKYVSLNFERNYYELFFTIGTKEFSDNFDEMQFDDNGFTTIENLDYENILTIAVKKNGFSKEDFIKFFSEDKNTLTEEQIIGMEQVFVDVLLSIKGKINKSIYYKNVQKIMKLWEIEQIRANKKFYLVTNSKVGAFVVGKKNGRIQIIYFPDSND